MKIENLYIISRRKLTIKVVPVYSATFIKAQDIGYTVFFDKESAEKALDDLIVEKRSKK